MCTYRESGLLRTGGTQIIKWTAEGAGKGRKDSVGHSRKSCEGIGESAGSEGRVYRDVRHTSVAGDMMVSHRVYGIAVNQGGTADQLYVFAPDRM